MSILVDKNSRVLILESIMPVMARTIEDPSLISRLRGVCVALKISYSRKDNGKALARAIREVSEETWEAASKAYEIRLEADGTPIYT